MANLEMVVRNTFGTTLSRDPDTINMNAALSDEYAITSLQMVIIVTTICEECNIPLTLLTEKDIESMVTPNAVISILQAMYKETA